MNARLQRLLNARDGVMSWSEACRRLPTGVVEHASRVGHVVLPYRGVIVDSGRELDRFRRLRAALAYAGPGAAISHTSALWLWRLPMPDDGEVHVTTGPGRRMRAGGIVAHRRTGFAAVPPDVLVRLGLLLRAIGQRMTTPDRVRTALARVPKLSQRKELVSLLEKVAAGCRSPLELWGYDNVFSGPGFEGLSWQVPVRLGARSVWLDAYDEETQTNFELDGAKYHGSPKDRERDLRRDAALATIGIQAVRYSHHRLTREVDEVRREALAIMAARRDRWTLSRALGAQPRG